jgi:Rha family phage regulatory protein
MNEIVINNSNGQLTVSSVQVAENFGKQHKDVLKSIEKISSETSAQIFANLFIESTYPDKYGRNQKCYEMTRDGFSLLVMGFTGSKALEWKLKYIQAFNEMEKALREPKAKTVKANEDKEKALEVRMMNAKVKMSNQYLKLASIDTLSEDWKKILVSKSAEVLAGEKLLPLPESEKTYSAKEVGDILGISAQKIGRIANEYGMKTSEYGKFYKDKSKYSNKEVDTFRYNEKAIDKFREIIE